MAWVEEITQNETVYHRLRYSNHIKQYIVKGTYEYDKCGGAWGGFSILLANRILKSIDYTNQYEATPGGRKIKYYALTFTYTLTEKLHGLPKITKQFEGKAKAYLDPDDGKWKLENLSLSDSGSQEYMAYLEKTAKFYSDEGIKNLKEKNYDQAIENFSKAITIDPNYVKAYNARGITYSKKEQYDMAIEDYNKAITTDPNYVPAYNNRGNAYKNKGQYDKAIEDYNKSIAIDSKRVAAYYNLACAYSLQGNQSKACDYLSIAIEKGYKNWEHIKKDSDFNNIRNSDCYKRIMSGR